MKRIISLAIVLLMIVSTMAVSVSAECYNYSGSWDYQFTLKKAKPENVIKDGKIGEGEYQKLDVITDPEEDGNMFSLGYTNADLFDYAENMLRTMEYYCSWDETHGFNIAVRCKPHELKQTLSEGSDKSKPLDDFLQNLGFQIEMFKEEHRNPSDFTDALYYSIARRTDNGEYLRGHWGQFGIKGSYDPVAGQDFVIEYDFNTGYVTCEWSIPISQVIAGDIGEGTEVFFSFAVTSGLCDEDEASINGQGPVDTYMVGLGDYCFLGKRGKDSKHITATLSDEIIPGGGSTAGDNGGSTGGNGSGNNGSGNTDGGNNGGYNGGTVDPVNGDNGGNNSGNGGSAKTGDAMLILAAVSAVSAAGAFISKKRRG